MADGFFERIAIVKWAVVLRAIIDRISRKRNGRPFAFHVDAYIALGFVVTQQHIVARHIALDHLALEKQRIDLTFHLDPVRINDLADERHGLVVPSARILKILPHTIFQYCRLADIDDLATRRLMKIHARRARERLKLLLQLSIHSY